MSIHLPFAIHASHRTWRQAATLLLLALLPAGATLAACRDNVVLVHGNTGAPSDFQNTYDALLADGRTASQIHAPAWGNPLCAGCNDHRGSEETPVRQAISSALAASCTGRVDVIGHSMGATLAARQIDVLGAAARVDAFIGIAGAFRGLRSCGRYPYNVPTTTCGVWGLSIGSPFLRELNARTHGARMYSMKSWSDLVVCSFGSCMVDGAHASSIPGERASYTYPYGHFGLLWYTAVDQVALID